MDPLSVAFKAGRSDFTYCQFGKLATELPIGAKSNTTWVSLHCGERQHVMVSNNILATSTRQWRIEKEYRKAFKWVVVVLMKLPSLKPGCSYHFCLFKRC